VDFLQFPGCSSAAPRESYSFGWRLIQIYGSLSKCSRTFVSVNSFWWIYGSRLKHKNNKKLLKATEMPEQQHSFDKIWLFLKEKVCVTKWFWLLLGFSSLFDEKCSFCSNTRDNTSRRKLNIAEELNVSTLTNKHKSGFKRDTRLKRQEAESKGGKKEFHSMLLVLSKRLVSILLHLLFSWVSTHQSKVCLLLSSLRAAADSESVCTVRFIRTSLPGPLV